MRLLQVYYTREGTIADAEKYRIVGARSPEERQAVDAVLAEFFVQDDDDAWCQSRCDREIVEYQEKAARNRMVGQLGGRPVKDKNPEITQTVSKRNPDVTLASSQEPIANKEKEEKKESVQKRTPISRGCRIPDGFPAEPEFAWCRGSRPELTPELVGSVFRDYHLARGSTMKDWAAAWRTWVGKERATTQPRASPWQSAADARDAKRAAFLHDLTGGLMGSAPTDNRTIENVEPPRLASIAGPRR
jgi:uncharacterized protein YdaU (DUF1376 family)